ncbi:MAG: hypothetical protein JSR46_08820 [Verrucomicrobia bacterium]|nr:hypothetical protein [Verrucomicrobiota bacterium]
MCTSVQNLFYDPFASSHIISGFDRSADVMSVFSYCSSRVQKVAEESISAIQESLLLTTQFASLFVSNHVLLGLCKITGYEVLRHGTSWCNFLSIVQNGADPTRGGETTGAARAFLGSNVKHLAARARGHFYVTRDSELSLDANCGPFTGVVTYLAKSIIPSMHAFLVYIKVYQEQNLLSPKNEVPAWALIGCLFCAIFTPKIQFIYSLEEIHGNGAQPAIFENDPDYRHSAYQTSELLPRDRIGLLGLVANAKKEHVFEHISNNPGRVAEGVAQLAVGIFLTATGLGLFF